MHYADEIKQETIAQYQAGSTITELALKHRIARSTLYSWIKPRSLYQTAVMTQQAKMSAHTRKLESIIEVLQKAGCSPNAPLQDKLHKMELLYGEYSVHVLCEAMKVPRGTFYNHMFRNKRDNSSYQIRRTELSEQIRTIYDKSNQIFGAKKINAVLRAQGIITCEKMVSELMNEMNLSSIRLSSKRVRTPRSRNKKRDALGMKFSVNTPNKVWVSDVTYFRLNERMYYICVILDLFSRRVIAHKISLKHRTQLITATFKQAYHERQPEAGLVFHSDQGQQYASCSFQKFLAGLGVKQSFSPSGSPHHNAVMESFFGSMKKEELYRKEYRSDNEFKKCLGRYFAFYNDDRPHLTLQCKTPNAYESAFFARTDDE